MQPATLLRSIGALVRKDLTDVRLLLAFVLLVDVAIVLLAHLVLTDVVLTIGLPAVAIGVLSVLPVIAEIYSVDERVGTVGLIRSLPVGRWTRSVSKVAALGCVLCLGVACTVLTQWLLYELGVSVYPGQVVEGPGWWGAADELTRPNIIILGTAVLATALCAAGVRHALVALVAPVVGVGLLVGITSWFGSTTEDWLRIPIQAVVNGASHPLGAALAIVFLLAMTPLRGIAGRSLGRRSFMVVATPMLLASVAVAGVGLRGILRGVPELELTNGRAVDCELSPDGTQLAVRLVHGDGQEKQTSIWIADTTDWEFTRVPELLSPIRSWSTSETHVSIERWTHDGRQLLVSLDAVGWRYEHYFTFDPVGSVYSPSTYGDAQFQSAFQFDRVRNAAHVELLDGSVREIQSYRSRPKVPARANDAVFYLDDDRALHRLDRATGEDRVLSVDPDLYSYVVGPDGRFVAIRRSGRHELVDLETGRSRLVPGGFVRGTRRGAMCIRKLRSSRCDWTLFTIDSEELITFERDVANLVDLDGHRWLAWTLDDRSLCVFDADGSLVQTLFEGGER